MRKSLNLQVGVARFAAIVKPALQSGRPRGYTGVHRNAAVTARRNTEQAVRFSAGVAVIR